LRVWNATDADPIASARLSFGMSFQNKENELSRA
jgi:hypothetical protein